ncbi:MAG: glycoside hydrolase family 130 protein [Polyangiaceae bacterium]|nr:glycoside hydrolase family 130 protein [Polyangiaceae bacterium]
MLVQRTSSVIYPNQRRVLVRPLQASSERQTRNIVARVTALSPVEVEVELAHTLEQFRDRHTRLTDFLLARCEQLGPYLPAEPALTHHQRLLLGAYFSQEYAIESAALFNPSMVWHPDQSGVASGSRRFILSLRAAGEGHISSIAFRSGTVDAAGTILVDPATSLATAPEPRRDASYERPLFARKLAELGLRNAFSTAVMEGLGETFCWTELQARLDEVGRELPDELSVDPGTASGIRALAESNYEVSYAAGHDLSERVIFPCSPAEANGIEDARFVEFVDDDGTRIYYATYTAYDGQVILPQFLETADFLHFKINTLNGPGVANKGMALFPRRIDGKFAMVARQDNENLYLMLSENIHFWYDKHLLARPSRSWEFVQLGNCGSPIETEAGWLLLTHGVGAMRRYCIGAMLLDRDDPLRVIGRLDEPLLSPTENEREGYVPNVVYSCGGQIHGRCLIVPYAMSDYASCFAIVDLDRLLEMLTAGCPMSG